MQFSKRIKTANLKRCCLRIFLLLISVLFSGETLKIIHFFLAFSLNMYYFCYTNN